MIDAIFAYGPLMKGFEQFPLLGEIVSSQPASTQGLLYHFEFRRPILLDVAEGRVEGELHTLRWPREILKEIDDIHGFTEYDPADMLCDLRVVKDVVTAKGETIQAYCYVFPAERRPFLDRVGERVEKGDWKRFLAAREYAPLPALP